MIADDQPSVALLGWGRMGGAIGRRLLAASVRVTMFDPSAAACDDARSHGADIAADPAGATSTGQILVTVLPDAPAVQAAVDGPSGILAGLAEGMLWMEMSSSVPAVTRELAQTVGQRGVLLLDAPVTGGVSKAVVGELTVMAGGTQAALAAAQPVLQHIAAYVFHVGPEPGMGDLVKTINNLLSAANLLIAAEGLAIAHRAGVDLSVLLDVVNAGTGQSNATSWKIPRYVLPASFNSQFSIGQYFKDLNVALGVADEGGLHLPMSHAAFEVWQSMMGDSLASRDHTEVVPTVMERAENGHVVPGAAA